MNGQRYITQAIIAALCEHPDQDKYKNRAFAGENLKKVMDAMSGQGQKLSKADFFTADDDGKFIIDTPGFWKNFEQVTHILKQNNETFVAGDFSKPLNGREDGRTLLESAAQYNGLATLFSYNTWEGRYDDMEMLWYNVSSAQRQSLFKNEGYINLDLKRQLLAAEGIALPEDGLAAAGVKAEDLTKTISERGGYQNIKRALNDNGDYFRKSYLLLPDREGNTVFAREETWRHYEDIVQNLDKHGERLEISDLIRQNGTRLNILARAAENNALHQVFTPSHWEGRLNEMRELWSYILPGWKKGLSTAKDFDLYYAQAEDLTYKGLVTPQNVVSRLDLVQPLNAGEDGAPCVLPLGLKSTWEQFDAISASIRNAGGENINLSDLRQTSGGLGHSCLITAIKCGAFDKVVKHLRDNGEQLLISDFMSKDRHGVTMLDLLAERQELSRAFTPDLWVGRVADMKTLWNNVRISDRKQVDIQQVEVAVKQATLKQTAKDRFKFPKGPF